MAERGESKELAIIPPAGAPVSLPMPAAAIIVLRQTPNAAFAAEEFIKATLTNEHTRRAYGRIAGSPGATAAGSSCARSRPGSLGNTSASSQARRPPGTRRSGWHSRAKQIWFSTQLRRTNSR